MESINQIPIAVIDDHTLVRNQVSGMLEDMGFHVVFQAENGQVGLEKIEQAKRLPDVCIVDVNMPVMNGFATAKALRSKYPDLKILAYSMNNDEKNIIDMVHSGARGYITKGCDPKELKRAIEVLHKGGCYLDAEATKTIMSYLRKGAKN